MNSLTTSPTVLIVDDDPNIIKILQRKVLSETFLGVAAVTSMRKAKKLIDNHKVKFDAVISDLGFSAETLDQKNGLFTGIDLLAHTREVRPSVSKFVISVFSSDEGYREAAEQQQLDVIDWYEKLEMSSTKPWKQIEKHLFFQNFNCTEDGRNFMAAAAIEDDIDKFLEILHGSFRPVTRNYIVELPDDTLDVIKPIEVIGKVEDKLFFLSALNIGLPQAGIGEDFNEAMDELKSLILTHFEYISELNLRYPSVATEKLKSAMDTYIVKTVRR